MVISLKARVRHHKLGGGGEVGEPGGGGGQSTDKIKDQPSGKFS